MPICVLCHQQVAASDARSIPAEGREVLVHESCFAEFAPIVRAALGTSNVPPPVAGLDRLASLVDGKLVLVHRSFPNEQMPFLVYLTNQKDAVVVSDIYEWAEQNELHIGNPANQLLRLKNKGLVATFDKDGKRVAVITREGRRAIEEYAATLD